MNADDIVDEMPTGYRWANEIETERFSHPAYFNKMVQVKVIIPEISNVWETHCFTNLAIKES